jgi:hypothetical protein
MSHVTKSQIQPLVSEIVAIIDSNIRLLARLALWLLGGGIVFLVTSPPAEFNDMYGFGESALVFAIFLRGICPLVVLKFVFEVLSAVRRRYKTR